ncbi:hypothetical protein OUZ56_002932 [Daphnia magna]|uniref:Secreted protein n=1 Tax=Daphnia magna TaxID=35525 RepID=A0ABR0A7A5_9CRUS|nr:hypothetical protein OUZ56_002932 [Daphnia magna]
MRGIVFINQLILFLSTQHFLPDGVYVWLLVELSHSRALWLSIAPQFFDGGLLVVDDGGFIATRANLICCGFQRGILRRDILQKCNIIEDKSSKERLFNLAGNAPAAFPVLPVCSSSFGVLREVENTRVPAQQQQIAIRQARAQRVFGPWRVASLSSISHPMAVHCTARDAVGTAAVAIISLR